MKRKIPLVFLALMFGGIFAADMTGNYNTWLGYIAGINADGERSTMQGAGAGGEATGIIRTDYVGAAAGAYSSNMVDCVGMGYRALRGASDMSEVVAIGAGALASCSNLNRATWLNGHFFAQPGEFWISCDKNWQRADAPIYYTNGTMTINVPNVRIINGTLDKSSIDLSAYAKKDEVDSAISTVMKTVSEHTALHALNLETIDRTAHFSPLDGKANYAAACIALDNGQFDRQLVIEYNVTVPYDNPDPDGAPVIKYTASTTVTNFSVFGWAGLQELGYTEFYITVHDEVIFTDYNGKQIGHINKDASTRCYLDGVYSVGEAVDAQTIRFYNDALVTCDITTATSAYVSNNEYSQSALTYTGVAVTMPSATNHARQFTLSLETDTGTAKAVTWNGGTVIEKFAGASNLSGGRTVWIVREVAPNIFLIDRTP